MILQLVSVFLIDRLSLCIRWFLCRSSLEFRRPATETTVNMEKSNKSTQKSNDPLIHSTYSKCHCMRDPEFGNISGPQRFEMIRQANFTTSIHLRGFSVQFGKCNFRCCRWICDWNLFNECNERLFAYSGSTRYKEFLVLPQTRCRTRISVNCAWSNICQTIWSPPYSIPSETNPRLSPCCSERTGNRVNLRITMDWTSRVRERIPWSMLDIPPLIVAPTTLCHVDQPLFAVMECYSTSSVYPYQPLWNLFCSMVKWKFRWTKCRHSCRAIRIGES